MSNKGLPTKEEKLVQKKAVEEAVKEGYNNTGYPNQQEESDKTSYCGAMREVEGGYIHKCNLPRGHEGKHGWEE